MSMLTEDQQAAAAVAAAASNAERALMQAEQLAHNQNADVAYVATWDIRVEEVRGALLKLLHDALGGTAQDRMIVDETKRLLGHPNA